MLVLLGDILAYAVPVALSPLPIIAAVMLLLAPAGRRGGQAFLAGRIATLAVATLAVAALAGRMAPPGSRDAGGLRILIGVLLVIVAVIIWRRRPRGTEVPTPRWMQSIQRMGPAQALRLGALITVANVKELAFAIGAGVIIGTSALSPWQTVAGAAAFAGLGSLGAAAPVIWLVAAGDGAREGLGAAADWLVRNNAIVMAALFLVIGAMMIGKGLGSL